MIVCYLFQFKLPAGIFVSLQTLETIYHQCTSSILNLNYTRKAYMLTENIAQMKTQMEQYAMSTEIARKYLSFGLYQKNAFSDFIGATG